MMGNDRQTCVLGIDAGGTKIRYGFITVKGSLPVKNTDPTVPRQMFGLKLFFHGLILF